MFAIEKHKDIVFILLLIMTILPIISLFGHIFTRDGRESLKINPFMILYFIVFGIFAYMYWYNLQAIYDYLGFSFVFSTITYAVLCCVPLFEKNPVN